MIIKLSLLYIGILKNSAYKRVNLEFSEFVFYSNQDTGSNVAFLSFFKIKKKTTWGPWALWVAWE